MTLIDAKNHPINCGVASSTGQYSFKKRNIDNDFSLRLNKIIRITNDGIEDVPIVNKDLNLLSYTNSGYVEDVEASIDGKGYLDTILYESDSTNIIKSSNNMFSYQQDGQVIIKATDIYGFSQLAKTNIKSYTPSTTYKFVSWIDGSLSKHVHDNMISMLDSGDANNKNLFTNEISGTPLSYTRNTNLWMTNVDFTCLSPWNSVGKNLMAGTAISKKHVLFCKHLNFFPTTNSTIKFVTNDNQIITRTLSKVTPLGDISSFYPDVTIGTLDQELPNSIKIASILPSNYKNYFPNASSNNPFKLIGTITNHQDKNIGMSLLDSFINDGFTLTFPRSAYNSEQYFSFYKPTLSGDSGSPIFMLINGNLVLIGIFTGPGGGNVITTHMSEINDVMSIDGSYSLTTADLSSFISSY